MNIAESNKLIADFMGLPLYRKNDDRYEWEESHITSLWFPKEMLYPTNWEWLMPVVRKCHMFNPSDGWSKADRIENIIPRHAFERNDIKEVYEAVVEFILWHNENYKK
jgi:hypothetical protein